MIRETQIEIIVKVSALSLSNKQGDKGNGVIKKLERRKQGQEQIVETRGEVP